MAAEMYKLFLHSSLNLLVRVTSDLVVNKNVISRRVSEELPFMATENILMACVKKGGDRQELHEKIRQHSHAAATKIKADGGINDLLDHIANDPTFPLSKEELNQLLNVSHFVGRAPQQVDEFLT